MFLLGKSVNIQGVLFAPMVKNSGMPGVLFAAGCTDWEELRFVFIDA